STNRISAGPGVNTVLYAVQEGTMAVETRLDPDCMAGRTIGDPANPIKQWGRTVLPTLGIEAGTFYTQDCSDESNFHAGTTGLTRTVKRGYWFDFDLCVATAYNSDPNTRHNPILKAEIASSLGSGS